MLVITVFVSRGTKAEQKPNSACVALVKAIENDDTRAALKALTQGADPNYRDPKTGATPLFLQFSSQYHPNARSGETSSRLDNPILVTALLAHGAHIDARDAYGRTPLMLAASCGATRSVRVFVGRGADVNAIDSRGDTVLMHAVSSHHVELLKFLIGHGAEVNGRSPYGYTALMAAANDGTAAEMKLLIRSGADVNAQTKDGTTAFDQLFHFIVPDTSGDPEQLVKADILRQAGANTRDRERAAAREVDEQKLRRYWHGRRVIRQRVAYGAMILLCCALLYLVWRGQRQKQAGKELIGGRTMRHGGRSRMGKADVVVIWGLILIGLPADLVWQAYQQKQLDAALIDTIEHNDPIAVEILLMEGADANTVVQDRKPPTFPVYVRSLLERFRHRDAADGGEPAIIDAMTLRASDGTREALEEPAQKTAMVRALLAHGVSANLRYGPDAATPLMMAAYEHCFGCAQALLAYGADVNAVSRDGDTALVSAANENSSDIALMLVRRGANVNARRSDGSTALMWAAHYGQLDLVKTLLLHGADVKVRNDVGGSVLLSATRPIGLGAYFYNESRADLVRMLLQHGADVNVVNRQGDTPLLCGAYDSGVLRLLVDHKARVNVVDQSGYTPLLHIAHLNRPDDVRYLLAHGANVNAQAPDGRTALMIAMQDKASASVAVLLRAGAHLPPKNWHVSPNIGALP